MAGSSYLDLELIRNVISKSVTDNDNSALCLSHFKDKVWVTVFALGASSALGPDGFLGLFFKHYWDTIGNDVAQVLIFFFQSGFLPLRINSYFMMLLLKFDGANSVHNFGPIMLGNLLFKIISKILANRLGSIAS